MIATIYRESKEFTEQYKRNYVDGLDRVIAQRQKDAEASRQEYIRSIFESPDRYRADFRKMLGWPLVEHTPDKLPAVVTEKLSQEDGYCVYRMQFEILDGLWLSGLLFKRSGDAPKPLVIVQHGGWGTPELISGIYGSTDNYNNMLQRVIEHDVHAFAPQLLLWSEDYQVGFDRNSIDARLKRVGSSITAVEVYGITRILDYFEQQSDVSAFGMVGLSYGGFYTLYTAAADTRIKSAISCSYFNKRDAVPWSDWTWFKSAEKFDDAQIACLVYPRKLCIEIGDKDELFDYQYGVESFETVKQISQTVGLDWISFRVFGGVHEFFKDDEPIRALTEDLRR